MNDPKEVLEEFAKYLFVRNSVVTRGDFEKSKQEFLDLVEDQQETRDTIYLDEDGNIIVTPDDDFSIRM